MAIFRISTISKSDYGVKILYLTHRIQQAAYLIGACKNMCFFGYMGSSISKFSLGTKNPISAIVHVRKVADRCITSKVFQKALMVPTTSLDGLSKANSHIIFNRSRRVRSLVRSLFALKIVSWY